MKIWKKRLIGYGLVGTVLGVMISSHYYPWVGPAALMAFFLAVIVYIIEDLVRGKNNDGGIY